MINFKFIQKWVLGVITLYWCLVIYVQADLQKKCLTGYMTDVQGWVAEHGSLREEIGKLGDVQNSIDLSANTNPVQVLHKKMAVFRASSHVYVKYLSMARCKLNRIPPVFELKDSQGRYLWETIEYMTFYGNAFVSQSEAGDQYEISLNATSAVEVSVQGRRGQQEATQLWAAGFQDLKFNQLKEFDLRACSIQILNANLFKGMRALEALYIGENEIYHIDSQSFSGLNNLLHLDMSRNPGYDVNGNLRNMMSEFAFDKVPKLESLDLSHTTLPQRNLRILNGLGKSLKSLSLCETGLTNLPEGIFNRTSLQILDLSRNSGILTNVRALRGLENSLQVLYATEIGLQTINIFENFSKLQILQLSHNEINSVRSDIVKTLHDLIVLDLNQNRLTSWFEPLYSLIPKLKILSLKDNNINVISEEIIQDTANISYLALSGNFIVCNCHVKDFYKMASMNERQGNDSLLKTPKNQLYHRGYKEYNRLILNRKVVEFDFEDQHCDAIEDSGTFKLLDYRKGAYSCLAVPGSNSVMFYEVDGCGKTPRDINYDHELAEGKRKLLVLLVIPCVLLPLAVLFVFRRNIRYCCIVLKNSTMIGLINKIDTVSDDTIFHYDVFVSYCNEDRGWVLDHLLPNMEAECSISACLHERDFQVGLSILENIVSCMDRSRSIMLIISQRFLLSQWCQFEMHLAQHRLLETRREDLTLVLLEEIPRRLRPNTLHYLMLTKTYIVWPKEESDRQLFWRRLNKSLISHRIKQGENVSLA